MTRSRWFLGLAVVVVGCSGKFGSQPDPPDAGGEQDPTTVDAATPGMDAAHGMDAPADGPTDAMDASVDAEADAPAAPVVVNAAAGIDFTCAYRSDGYAACWGANGLGQLGDNSTAAHDTAKAVPGLATGVTAIAAGELHACAIVNGGAKCWGYNGSQQVGVATGTNTLVATNVTNLTTGVLSLSLGAIHSCAVVTGGGVKCWGSSGGAGGLGNSNLNSTSSAPVDVTGLASGVTAIATTSYSTCALKLGALTCWGGNNNGQLGNNATGNQAAPVANGLTTGVTSVSGGAGAVFGNNGARHMCAVQSGAALCWGQNDKGQLGNNSVVNPSRVPVPVQGLSTGVVAVTANGFHSCALTTAGGVKCWGANDKGQLGNPVATQSLVPVDVMGLTSGVKAITAGGYHTCAVTTLGKVKCWGLNDVGQLGNGGLTGGQSATPLDVSGL